MPTSPPNTAVRTSHAVTIRINGIVIGMINQWAPTHGRTITPIFELNAATSGTPTEKTPGNITGQTIGVQRYDLYTSRLEQAIDKTLSGIGAGTTPNPADLNMLSDQTSPFQVLEKWQYPNGSTETVQYDGCWFSNLGRTLRSDGDRLVNVNATLEWTKRTFIQG
jgi:hypothetical protein